MVEFGLLQADGRVAGQHAAVEDEVHDRPGTDAVRRSPADDQQWPGVHLEAEFLFDLAATADVRRLAVFEDPARQRPVVPVVGLDQQDPAGRVGEQRGRGAEHGGKLSEPRGLVTGYCAGCVWHEHDPIRAADPHAQ
jgi:hypothetical protein